jgi:hypothetical protein
VGSRAERIADLHTSSPVSSVMILYVIRFPICSDIPTHLPLNYIVVYACLSAYIIPVWYNHQFVIKLHSFVHRESVGGKTHLVHFESIILLNHINYGKSWL